MRVILDPNVLVSAAVAAGVSAELLDRWFVDRLEAEAEPWPDPTEVPPVTGDPKDDYLVALYRDADADVLVSGDSDLLELDADDLTVVTPGELLQRL